MPPETNPTQEAEPTDGIPAPEESTTAADHIANAAKLLEYSEEKPKPKETPEEIALAELEGTPKPKVEKKTQKAAKPEPEPAPEPPKEPKKTKRELFMEKADKEAAFRKKEASLKEREQEVQSMKAQYEEMMVDPVAFLEKRNPRFFEEMVDRYSANGDIKKESTENNELKQEIEELKKLITGQQETQQEKEQKAYYQQQLNEGIQILQDESFADVHKVAEQYQNFTGRPVDLQRELAKVWIEFKNQYGKELTPRETCEILLEDAQAHLERVSAPQAEPPAEIPTKKAPPPTGNTLSQQQETASEPEPPRKYRTDRGRDAFIRDIAFGELKHAKE